MNRMECSGTVALFRTASTSEGFKAASQSSLSNLSGPASTAFGMLAYAYLIVNGYGSKAAVFSSLLAECCHGNL
jgi:hypothetical protein